MFKLSETQLKEIATALKEKIEAGLEADNTEIQCIPTYIYPQTSEVTGQTIVLDLGGTNYRVAAIDLQAGKPTIHPENGWKKDLSVMKTPGFTEQDLYEEQTDPIKEIKRAGELPIGYCFSFPAESLPNGDAKLLRWTKGVDIKEMIGKPVGQSLIDYLNAHTTPAFSGIKVVNDTVASLFAGLTDKDFDAYIGLIVGTGTNMAAFFHPDKIKKLKGKYNDHPWIPVNLESGNFHPPHLTKLDNILDACSTTVGAQRFEKAVSSMYLGNILKGMFPFDEFEENFDARKLTTILSYPDLHKQKYVRVARWIYKQSAHLVAASLVGLILVLISQDPKIRRIRLVAEGSLFWSENRKGKNYKDLVMEELHKLLASFGRVDIQVHIHYMEDANLIGTAIAALS
ncbi:MAG: hexokinase [Tannerellaceae bacterium]|nr:hexokinase [Tannerellaceae bacterium]